MPTQTRVERQPIQPKPFPNPAFCSAEKYLSLLLNAVNDLAPLCPTTKPSRATIEKFNASLLDRMKSCANQSKLPYHSSNAAPGKMPWWSKALWELRDKMRCAYKCKTLANSPTNQAAYSALKAEYQKMIRFSKAENFKSMCSTTEDLFGTLRELTSRGSYPFPTAICSSGFTHTDTVAILKEFGKAFFPPSIPSTVMHCELENNCNAFMSKTH